MNDLSAYLSDLQMTLGMLPIQPIERVIRELERARNEGRHVFIFGNGGSASTASHFICDLAKNTRHEGGALVKAVGLSDNMALMTAYGNDEGYESVFAQQLSNLVAKDDVVIAISTSGNSPNVLRAIELARTAGARTIALTGATGGKLAALSDINVHVPSQRIEHVEDVHLVLEHMITARLRSGEETAWIQWPVIERQEDARPSRNETDQVRDGELSADSGNSMHWRAVAVDDDDNGNERVVQRLLALSVESVGALSGCAVLVDENAKARAGYLTYQGRLWEAAGETLEEVLEHGLAGWVMLNQKPVLIKSTADDPRWLHRAWDDASGAPRSVLSVPIVAADRLFGVLTMVYPAANRFTRDDLVLVSAISTGLAELTNEGISNIDAYARLPSGEGPE